MTRKRFVKRMMGLGYSRNEANDLAERARRYGMRYDARWRYERIEAFGRELSRGFTDGLEAVSRRLDELRAVLQNATSSALEAARKCAAALAAVTFYKIDPADDAEEHAPAWPKENPYLRITDVSLVASGGVPLNYGQNCDGLRTNVVLADELAASAPPLTHEEIKATTAKWPGTTVMVGVDLANGPDMAAEITVVGGAENATD